MSDIVNGQDHLCSRCAHLDIASVRSSTRPRLNLGPPKDWQPDTCNLCNFLVHLLSRSSLSDLQKELSYFLFSIKTENVPDKLFQILDHRVIVLSTSESGLPPGHIPYIVASVKGPPKRLNYLQPSTDFDLVKEWLQICTILHGDNCNGDPEYKIENLKLIDCSTGQVVQTAFHEPYVALSYVWGQENASARGQSGYPRTIQDAMAATRMLGYRWLWVDKYCTDQTNLPELQWQLQQMDIIYQQATITIVAAAGTNPNYGLPGVDKSYRSPTRVVHVGGEHLCALPRIELRPDNCRWTSRAWTYQEGLLSTRRLIFTDEQVYFECQGCYYPEMLNIPFDTFKKMHHPNTKDKPWFQKRYRVSGRMGFFPIDGCGVDPWDMYNRISEYTERSLSNESDILNGILGIFRAFERMGNSLRHLGGLAYPGPASSPNETVVVGRTKRALPTFSESLRWDLLMPSKRRKGFPSWSWTGWYGKIIWPAEYTSVDVVRTTSRAERPRNPKVNAEALKFAVTLENKSTEAWDTKTWGEFQAQYDILRVRNEPTIFLDIEAYTTEVSYSVHFIDEYRQEAHFLLHLSEGALEVATSITTAHELRTDDTYLALHFHQTVRGNRGRGIAPVVTQHFLVVQHMDTHMGGHWERVAIGFYNVDPEKAVPSIRQQIRLG